MFNQLVKLYTNVLLKKQIQWYKQMILEYHTEPNPKLYLST